jgi:predicted DNA-binding transcriptional regulator YafY
VSNGHRIAWIDGQIRAGRHPNASTIAARFEISRRQAARDIEYLRHSLGAPISYSTEHNGYRYDRDARPLPGLVVSEPERAALVYLAERYGSLDGEAAARVAGVLRRLGANAGADADVRAGAGGPAPVVAVDAAEIDAATALRRAVDARRTVAVRYRGADGIVVTRTLRPYAVVTRFGRPACVGYCEEIGLTQVFPLPRIERVERTGEGFEVPAHVRVRDWMRATMAPQPFVAVVRLDDPADAERIESAVTLGDGAYRIEFYDGGTIMSALLSCPSGFEVVSPGWLRARVADRLASLLARSGR